MSNIFEPELYYEMIKARNKYLKKGISGTNEAKYVKQQLRKMKGTEEFKENALRCIECGPVFVRISMKNKNLTEYALKYFKASLQRSGYNYEVADDEPETWIINLGEGKTISEDYPLPVPPSSYIRKESEETKEELVEVSDMEVQTDSEEPGETLPKVDLPKEATSPSVNEVPSPSDKEVPSPSVNEVPSPSDKEVPNTIEQGESDEQPFLPSDVFGYLMRKLFSLYIR